MEQADLSRLYREHLARLQRRSEPALEACGFDGLVLDAGTPFTYFADDQDAPFKRTPHFAHWVPLEGPYHLLHVRPGRAPRLVRVAPEDYWYEQVPLGEPFWKDALELEQAATPEEAWERLELTPRTAYVGDAPRRARAGGLVEDAIGHADLLARLDWERAFKSAYEVACLEEATRLAARGHLAAREAFEGGASEREIHRAYLAAAGALERELPYESIVALDEKGAILHYQGKRTARDGKVLLIDVGASCRGYGSDITRTWTRAGCEPLFRELVAGMERVQQELCAEVRPGLPFPDLHHHAHRAIADLLHASGVLTVGGEEAVARGLSAPFFPHGLGHLLGIQVHDVGGRQRAREGGTLPPPEGHPYLRTTRTIERDMVFTVEPGLYFIEMLLRPHRQGPERAAFDWRLIERLAPCGGIRIEDNVLAVEGGHRNLTRPHLP